MGIMESEEGIKRRSGKPRARVGVEDGCKTCATRGVVRMIFDESRRAGLVNNVHNSALGTSRTPLALKC